MKTHKKSKIHKKTYKNVNNSSSSSSYSHKKTLKLMQAKCSPKLKEKITGFSCYTFDDLRYLRNLWNKKHPKGTPQHIQTNNVRKIHKLLTQYNSPVCNSEKETCWLRQDFVKNSVAKQIMDFSFAPQAPLEWTKNPNEWLSSVEIENVMNQYEKAYKCFKFIGPSPIDFDKNINGTCVWNELCNFSLSRLIAEGKNKIGIIFNTDPHNKPGQHWISMFINIRRGQIYFFDSVGAKVPNEIMILVERIAKQGLSLNKPIKMTFDQNYPTEHQYGNTECGIYSLFFIVHMLEDKITHHYLKTHILKDKHMEKFRKIYFNDKL